MSEFVKPHTIEGWEQLSARQAERIAELTVALESSTRARQAQAGEIGELRHHLVMARASIRETRDLLRKIVVSWRRSGTCEIWDWGALRDAADLVDGNAQLRTASPGAEDIAAERERQIEKEGWTSQHDDEHPTGQLAQAAWAYIEHTIHQMLGAQSLSGPPDAWPWDDCWWKPRDARRNLVRAGALIAAAIDQLDRAQTGVSHG